MPETKINVRSPFILKYQDANIDYVQLDIYIYSGIKTTDRGNVRYTLKKYPVNNNDYVLFDLSELIRDYLTFTSNTPLNNNKGDYVKWVEVKSDIVTT